LDLILRQSVVKKTLTIFLKISKVISLITSKKLGGNLFHFSALLQPILLNQNIARSLNSSRAIGGTELK
jgi:hypothetical protein